MSKMPLHREFKEVYNNPSVSLDTYRNIRMNAVGIYVSHADAMDVIKQEIPVRQYANLRVRYTHERITSTLKQLDRELWPALMSWMFHHQAEVESREPLVNETLSDILRISYEAYVRLEEAGMTPVQMYQLSRKLGDDQFRRPFIIEAFKEDWSIEEIIEIFSKSPVENLLNCDKIKNALEEAGAKPYNLRTRYGLATSYGITLVDIVAIALQHS